MITPAGPNDLGVGVGIVPAGAKRDADNRDAASGLNATLRPGAPGLFAPNAAGRGGAGTSVPPTRGRGGFGRQPVSPKTAAVNARFFAAAQNDFAARLKWSVTPNFGDANHEPVVAVKGPLNISAKVGSTVRLQGQTSDPDGNSVTVKWWQYNDAGTYPGDITFSSADSLTTSFRVPSDAKPGQAIHVILEGTDNGTPPLTRNQRVIVTVVP